MPQRARHQHETVNKRFKEWGLLKQVYRHEIPGHGLALTAIAVIMQLAINGGEVLFECGYQDPPMTMMMKMIVKKSPPWCSSHFFYSTIINTTATRIYHYLQIN
jgi:hypothetical protein